MRKRNCGRNLALLFGASLALTSARAGAQDNLCGLTELPIEFFSAPLELALPIEPPSGNDPKQWVEWAGATKTMALNAIASASGAAAPEPTECECDGFSVQYFEADPIEILRVRTPWQPAVAGCYPKGKPDWTAKFRGAEPPPQWEPKIERERDVSMPKISKCSSRGAKSSEAKGEKGKSAENLASLACLGLCQPTLRCTPVNVTRWKYQLGVQSCPVPNRIHIEVWERNDSRIAEASFAFDNCRDIHEFAKFIDAARTEFGDQLVEPLVGSKTQWATNCP